LAVLANLRLPFLVGQGLSFHRNYDPVPFGIFLLLDVHREVDGAHDAVTEHFVDERLDRGPVDLRDLVNAVDQRIDRHGLADRSFHRDLLQGSGHFRLKSEHLGGGLSFLGRHGGLAEQSGGHPHGVPADRIGDFAEGKLFWVLACRIISVASARVIIAALVGLE